MNVACAEASRLDVPSVVVPSLKATAPVGMPLLGALAATVAVKVMGWPKTVGLPDEVNVAAVVAWVTVWLMAGLVLVVKLASTVDRGDAVGPRGQARGGEACLAAGQRSR